MDATINLVINIIQSFLFIHFLVKCFGVKEEEYYYNYNNYTGFVKKRTHEIWNQWSLSEITFIVANISLIRTVWYRKR